MLLALLQSDDYPTNMARIGQDAKPNLAKRFLHKHLHNPTVFMFTEVDG
jgi:hypothetical protein